MLDRSVKIGPPAEAHYHPCIDVAFVCTGNICRSPMAEAMLRARLAEHAPQVRVGSAGLVLDGRDADPHAVKAMAKRGLDLRSHRSRIIDLDLLAPVDLILGMERRHVREVANLDMGLFARSFTLPEFVISADLEGPRPAHDDLRTWVERIGNRRDPLAYPWTDPLTEVPDPYGRSARAFATCATTLEGLVDDLVRLAWPATPAAHRPSTPAHTGGRHADRDRL